MVENFQFLHNDQKTVIETIQHNSYHHRWQYSHFRVKQHYRGRIKPWKTCLQPQVWDLVRYWLRLSPVAVSIPSAASSREKAFSLWCLREENNHVFIGHHWHCTGNNRELCRIHVMHFISAYRNENRQIHIKHIFLPVVQIWSFIPSSHSVQRLMGCKLNQQAARFVIIFWWG